MGIRYERASRRRIPRRPRMQGCQAHGTCTGWGWATRSTRPIAPGSLDRLRGPRSCALHLLISHTRGAGQLLAIRMELVAGCVLGRGCWTFHLMRYHRDIDKLEGFTPAVDWITPDAYYDERRSVRTTRPVFESSINLQLRNGHVCCSNVFPGGYGQYHAEGLSQHENFTIKSDGRDATLKLWKS